MLMERGVWKSFVRTAFMAYEKGMKRVDRFYQGYLSGLRLIYCDRR